MTKHSGGGATTGAATEPPDDAWVSLSGGPDGETSVSGNSEGLTRLGSVLVRCAQDTAEAREYRSAGGAAKDLNALVPPGQDMYFEGVNLLKKPPVAEEPGKSSIMSIVALWGCGLALFALFVLVVLGLGVVAGFIKTV